MPKRSIFAAAAISVFLSSGPTFAAGEVRRPESMFS